MMRNFTLRHLTILFFAFASVQVLAQEEVYQIKNATVNALGFGKLSNWKPQFENPNLTGNFLVKNQSLASVSDLSMNFILTEADIRDAKLNSSIKKQLLETSIGNISFSQINYMILPVMKMAHFTMDVNLSGGNHFAPLSLYCKLEDDQSISVSGKQVIYLYQFGVFSNNIKKAHAEDMIVLDVKFSLIKAANLIAKASL